MNTKLQTLRNVLEWNTEALKRAWDTEALKRAQTSRNREDVRRLSENCAHLRREIQSIEGAKK